MTNPIRLLMAGALALVLTSCESVSDKKDPLARNVVDEANLSDMFLAAAAPGEAIKYFQAALAKEPERADYRRGLAISLKRAKRYLEAARVYQEMATLDQAQPADQLEYAVILARLERWDEVRSIVDALPDGLNTGRRHLIGAMLADHEQKWDEADAAYAEAQKLSTNPADVLNNWGVSQMSRGELPVAEELFAKALSYNSALFSAKNNLAIARGLQGNYQLPIVPLTETERAIILYNLGLIAERKGEKKAAKGLFAAAVDAHPQHYEIAASRLSALESVVEN